MFYFFAQIFRLISQRDMRQLSDSTLHNYNKPTVEHPTETQGVFGTIQSITSNISNRLWSWIPISGTTQTRPESAEPVHASRRTSRKSFAWAPSTYPTTEGPQESHTTNDDRYSHKVFAIVRCSFKTRHMSQQDTILRKLQKMTCRVKRYVLSLNLICLT